MTAEYSQLLALNFLSVITLLTGVPGAVLWRYFLSKAKDIPHAKIYIPYSPLSVKYALKKVSGINALRDREIQIVKLIKHDHLKSVFLARIDAVDYIVKIRQKNYIQSLRRERKAFISFLIKTLPRVKGISLPTALLNKRNVADVYTKLTSSCGNFLQEQANNHRLSRCLAKPSNKAAPFFFPKIMRSWSSADILIMQAVPGVPLSEYLGQASPRDAAFINAVLRKNILAQFFEHKFFHANLFYNHIFINTKNKNKYLLYIIDAERCGALKSSKEILFLKNFISLSTKKFVKSRHYLALFSEFLPKNIFSVHKQNMLAILEKRLLNPNEAKLIKVHQRPLLCSLPAIILDVFFDLFPDYLVSISLIQALIALQHTPCVWPKNLPHFNLA
ncbi:MAG: hypothetical protein LBE13_21260 [Bacteroidales bacterium]|jgi:hypothetical protein|nr:hypothetical protein [Bacteroidales bacterium]